MGRLGTASRKNLMGFQYVSIQISFERKFIRFHFKRGFISKVIFYNKLFSPLGQSTRISYGSRLCAFSPLVFTLGTLKYKLWAKKAVLPLSFSCYPFPPAAFNVSNCCITHSLFQDCHVFSRLTLYFFLSWFVRQPHFSSFLSCPHTFLVSWPPEVDFPRQIGTLFRAANISLENNRRLNLIFLARENERKTPCIRWQQYSVHR